MFGVGSTISEDFILIIFEENQFCLQTDSRPGNDPLPESVVGTESIHSLGRALDIELQVG